ncbi:hypothetical protein EfmJHP35_16400 [Enterococcus faecium]|nr:hypothetical protein EfmJHP35_16400 [Enterococcus faecium]
MKKQLLIMCLSACAILLFSGCRSYRLGALAQESINVVLSVLVREIRALEKNIKELDKAIEQVIVVIPEYQCLTSIPGVGKVYAAGLIAEICPRNN